LESAAALVGQGLQLHVGVWLGLSCHSGSHPAFLCAVLRFVFALQDDERILFAQAEAAIAEALAVLTQAVFSL
jgi:hypothetical protein